MPYKDPKKRRARLRNKYAEDPEVRKRRAESNRRWRNGPGRERILARTRAKAIGAVRALLCQHCNVAVGWLEGNADTLELARKYIQRFDVE